MAHSDETLGLDDFGEIDPDEAAPSRRRRMWPVGGALAAVVLVGGLVVWQPWAGDSASTPATSEPQLPAELVLDMPGLTLSSSVQAVAGRPAELPDKGFIFAAPDATLDDGPLLAFLVDDAPEDLEVDGGGATVDINGATATIEDTGSSIEVYWEGEPGVRYGVAGSGVPQSQVIAFARAVSYENGITTVDDPDALAGLAPVGDVRTMFTILGVVQPMFGSDSDAVTVLYDSERGGTVSLASMPAPAEFVRLAALLLDDEEVLEADGDTVIIGQVTASFGNDPEQRLLLVERGGRLIGILGTADNGGLLALLAAVRAATDDEWAAVLAVAQDDPFNFGGDEVSVTVAATDVTANTEP